MRWLLSLAMVSSWVLSSFAGDPWISYTDKPDLPGKGKHIVMISGDEEYRSEEALPMLAKILNQHHGFAVTVLFAIDPKDGTIQPNITNNIPGLEKLKTADLVVMFLRWRTIPAEQMKHISDYMDTGKPIIGLRTSTHPFKPGRKDEYAKYSSDSKVAGYEGGFGKQVFGETWVAHHGIHGKQGTRGVFTDAGKKSPILRGIEPATVFGPSDVYTVKLPLAEGSETLVLGEVTETLKPDSKALATDKNDPMMPVAWTKTYKQSDKVGQVFTTTMGASQDLAYEGTRRMVVNACFHLLSVEVPAKTNVEFVGKYEPTGFRFKKDNEWKPGVKPEDLK
ncbi:MAG: ThuA domain-containing protein [Fimbriiglobus sp.]